MNIHTLNRQRRWHAAEMGVAKPDFLRCVGADHILIENAERFARIDLDSSDFEKEHTQCYIYSCIATCCSLLPGDLVTSFFIFSSFDGISGPPVILLCQQFFSVVRKHIRSCSVIGGRCCILVVQRHLCREFNVRHRWLSLSTCEKNAAMCRLFKDARQCATSTGAEQHHWLFSNSGPTCCTWYGNKTCDCIRDDSII